MEPEKEQKTEDAKKHLIHSYADDLSKALDTTDASVVQELLSEGRAREALLEEEKKSSHQRHWYRAGALVLIICTLASAVYTFFYYKNLTVPVKSTPSVGVFPSINEVVVAKDTDIRKVVESLKTNDSLEEGKPYLLTIVSDDKNLTLLTPSEMFSFFEAKVSEPLINSFEVLRMGGVNIDGENQTFIIGLTKDTDISSKELLIAEPSLLQFLYRPLGIDLSKHSTEIGKEFIGEYLYNLPVRVLRYEGNSEKNSLLFFYARISNNIVIFATSPKTLKTVYENILHQND